MSKFIDITGKIYNKLSVEEHVGFNRAAQALFRCKCECGNFIITLAKRIKSGHTKSCGCFKKENARKIGHRNRLPYGQSSKNIQYYQYKKGAKNRDILFKLTKIEFENLIIKNCHYCNSPPSQFFQYKNCYGGYICNGIDRIDSKKEYTVENCVPCCTTCNYMKRNLSYEDFIYHIKKIYNFIINK